MSHVDYFLKGRRPGILILMVALFFVGVVSDARGDSPDFSREVSRLISRINTDAPGMENVRSNRDNPVKAAEELLHYFRKREHVIHPVDRKSRLEGLGKSAGEADMVAADNALKHVFVGQPAYPPYFCGDDINWGTRPVPDNEWVWQLNRMGFWNSLARAYWHTGDEKYAREWGNQLLDWTRKNPNDKEHAYAWRSIEAGIRGASWTSLFQRFIDSPSFTPEVLVAFLNSCDDHASYLMTKYTTRSNWALMEAEGMAFIAFTFPEFHDAVTWREEAIRRLNQEINLQVYPDGHQRELAIGYHMGCIGWFSRTLELAKMNGMSEVFPPSYPRMIEKMCEVPMKLGHPDGTSAQFGDAWAGKPGQYRGRFREWADSYGREDFLYLATDGREGRMPDSLAWALPYSGLYSMRSSWKEDAICLVLKCGPDGGGHCQPDNGTFELFAGGRNLMPDGGSYIYSGDRENRAWFRQTKVHQTLTLNGENSLYAPRLLLWKPGETLDILVVENQSYENLTHRRSLFFVDKRYFVIVDEATGTAAGEIDLHFQLAPGKAVADTENRAFQSAHESGWNVWVEAMDKKDLLLEEEEGQVSFLYTKKEPRPAYRFRTEKHAQTPCVRFVTVVAPYDREVPAIKAMIKTAPSGTTGEMEIEVTEAGKRFKIGYSL